MRKRLWLVGLVFLLAIPLIFLVRDFVRDVILVELLRMIWTVRILLDSLPQVLVWAVFLMILLNLAVTSLLRVRRGRRVKSEPSLDSVGQVQFLAMRIRSATQGEFYAWNLVRYLSKVVADVLAYDQGTTSDRAAWLVRSDEFQAPDEVRTYLQIGRTSRPRKSGGLLSRLRQLVAGSLEPRPSDRSLESVVRFLEDKLEE
jgi:uncharacterized MAPEG superfamily protein